MKQIMQVILLTAWVLIGTAIVSVLCPETVAQLLDGLASISIGNWKLVVDARLWGAIPAAITVMLVACKIIVGCWRWLCEDGIELISIGMEKLMKFLLNRVKDWSKSVLIFSASAFALCLLTTWLPSMFWAIGISLALGIILREVSNDRTVGIVAVLATMGILLAHEWLVGVLSLNLQRWSHTTVGEALATPHFMSQALLFQIYTIIALILISITYEMWLDTWHFVAFCITSIVTSTLGVGTCATIFTCWDEWLLTIQELILGTASFCVLGVGLCGVIVLHVKVFTPKKKSWFD